MAEQHEQRSGGCVGGRTGRWWQSRGVTTSATIRIIVLLVLFIGVVVYGWVMRPDLVRQYIGFNASARNPEQAMLFVNEELYEVQSQLNVILNTLADSSDSEKGVTVAVDGKNVRLIVEELEANPDQLVDSLKDQMERIRKDNSQALEMLASRELGSNGQNILWKNIDFAMEIIRKLQELQDNDFGKALQNAGVPGIANENLGILREIQALTSPRQRRLNTPAFDPDAPPPKD